MSNSYYEKVRIFLQNWNAFETRDQMVKEYAWAIPNDEAIKAIVDLNQSIVEVGAGTGYWGSLLEAKGVEVHLYDKDPPSSKWLPILKGTPQTIKWDQHSDHALLLCWPPYLSSMAYDCLTAYDGSVVIYVGEGDGGCTGDDAFHEDLEEFWECVSTVQIPQWWGIHDYLSIYVFKG